jgi:signal peptidase
MEIAPAPARRRLSSRALVVLLVAVAAPVTLLALVPTVLGLERYVVTTESAAGGIPRGSVVLERVVPLSDLEVGDVITYAPAGAAGVEGLVTRRIVGIDGELVATQGDDHTDRWLVPAGRSSVPRVVLAVPYVGYPFTAPVGRPGWVLLVVPGALLAMAALRGSAGGRSRRGDQSSPRWPVLGSRRS